MDKNLGMNKGTAQNRLVKDLLFNFVVAAGANACYHCGDRMTRGDFSIEHKKPWRGEEEAFDLFFNTSNVAYSHQSCNYSAARKPTKKWTTEEERLELRREYNKKYREKQKVKEAELSAEDFQMLTEVKRQERRERYVRTGN